METSELELVSTRQLIAELLRRTTFQGVIVHSSEEAKDPDWSGERQFSVRFSRDLDADRASRLLGVVSEALALRND